MTTDNLTTKQRKFCEVYAANGGNATDAARQAGYALPEKQGYQQLEKTCILDCIKTLTQPEQDKRIASAAERQAFWTSVMRGEIDDGDKQASLSDRLKASEILGKSQCDFINKTEITGKDGAALPSIFVNFIDGNDEQAS
jgi:phage terminase small subunit